MAQGFHIFYLDMRPPEYVAGNKFEVQGDLIIFYTSRRSIITIGAKLIGFSAVKRPYAAVRIADVKLIKYADHPPRNEDREVEATLP